MNRVNRQRNVTNVGAKDGVWRQDLSWAPWLQESNLSIASFEKSWKTESKRYRWMISEGNAGKRSRHFSRCSSFPFDPLTPTLFTFFIPIFFLYTMLPASRFLPVGKSTPINIGNALYCYFTFHQTKERITQGEFRKPLFIFLQKILHSAHFFVY